MKFLEDTNLSVVKQEDPIITIMTRAEAKIVGEALDAFATANKRKSTIKRIAQEWADKAPVFT